MADETSGGPDLLESNSYAWDRALERGNRWTIPVGVEEVARARRGDWSIRFTLIKTIPRDWYPETEGLDVLCLATGGGQQAPLLAAAGANVTVLDNSARQLAQDRLVAEREGLSIETVQGDMSDLSAFSEARFDLVVNAVSNLYIRDVHPMWREAYRVLRPGGSLLAGFMNPVHYLFDNPALERGEFRVAHRIPYSDLGSLNEEDLAKRLQQDAPLEFGHTLGDRIGGQIAAGFVLMGFFEDSHPRSLLGKFIPSYIVTRALKQKIGA